MADAVTEGKMYSGRAEPKPLHERVAEAIGWKHKKGYFGDCCIADPPNHPPRFDRDWSATGPLIKRYGISIAPDQSYPGMWGAWVGDFAPLTARADDLLLAVCLLILDLHKTGKLEAA